MLRFLLFSLIGLASAKAIADPCADGTYLEGQKYPYGDCSSFYYECVHGASLKRPCGAGTVYDATLDRCTFRDDVGCGGDTDPAPTTTKATTTTSVIPDTSSTTTTSAPPVSADGCDGHSHGDVYILDDGCYSYFYQCAFGVSHQINCPVDQVFNSAANRCDFPSNVPACGGEVPASTTTTEPVGCNGHAHGDVYILDDGCYDYFYQCVEGAGVKLSCNPDLVFDSSSSRCNYPENVPACGEGSASATTTTLKPESSDPTTTFTAVTSAGCGDHSNGDLYLPYDECYHFYLQCDNGIAVEKRCPHDLVFDTTIGQCNYPSRVPICGGESIILVRMPASTGFGKVLGPCSSSEKLSQPCIVKESATETLQ